MKSKIAEAIRQFYLTKPFEYEASNEELAEIAIKIFEEAIEQCMVWNDSDEHILVKDLRKLLKTK